MAGFTTILLIEAAGYHKRLKGVCRMAEGQKNCRLPGWPPVISLPLDRVSPEKDIYEQDNFRYKCTS